MTTTNADTECLGDINQSVIDRYSAKNMRIKHFTSADGWVPGLSGTDPVDSGSIADALKTIANSGSDSDVAAKLRSLVNALTRQPSESVQKAGVNQGATRGPLIIQSADKGARSKVVGTQAFDSNGRVTFSPQAIEAA
jgi:hypothetical protein